MPDVAPYRPAPRERVLAFMATLHALAGDWESYDAHVRELERMAAIPRATTPCPGGSL